MEDCKMGNAIENTDLFIIKEDIKFYIIVVLLYLLVNYYHYPEIEFWYEFCYALTITYYT
jgi:hypothetical protein